MISSMRWTIANYLWHKCYFHLKEAVPIVFHFVLVSSGCSNKQTHCLRRLKKWTFISHIFFLFFSFILIFNFTILYWFCHISTWIHHWYTCVPHPELSSLLPPVPSLWVVPPHQPQASSIVHWTQTGDSFHIWYYTCFNAILPNHPTLSLSHRLQKTVLYICASYAVLFMQRWAW